jgi:hypothetical protein
MNREMQKDISSRTNGWVILLSILFTLALIPTLLAITLNQTLFSENFVKTIFSEQQIAEKVPSILAETSLPASSASKITELLFSLMTKDQLTHVYQIILPEDYVQNQTGKTLDSLYGFINLQTSHLSLAIDLTPIKQNLVGQSGQSVVAQIEDIFPQCSQDQLVLLENWFIQPEATGSSASWLCKPAKPYLSIFTPLLTSLLQQTTQALPDQIIIFDEQNLQLATEIETPKIFNDYLLIRRFLLVIPWVALALGLLLILFSLRSLKSLLAGLGIPMLVAGGVDLLFYVVGKGMAESFIASRFQVGQVTFLNTTISSTALAAVRQISTYGFLIAGAAFIIGLLLTFFTTKLKAR